MTIPAIIENRGITELLHFTTNKGCLGILASRALKARSYLNEDARLEYIFQPNAANRSRDLRWLGYVNLSVSAPNTEFFSISAGTWHKYKDIWWCIMSFDPEILSHPSVVFCTSNNIWGGCARDEGGAGLEAMFAPVVYGRYSTEIRRNDDLSPNFPTSEQAEVLYPREISTDYLRKIYVPNEAIGFEVQGQMGATDHPPVVVEHNADLFRNIR
ncbi:DarT ssDNA thymidine ADP-ribosyltransferase family protein [Achromobacter xylosoxidans]|uniref:DUF4433 domain-containing protein n=1 Tax=Alcaligenes xylosoxydans xylosoxydans TaxID=85698 RepID=A0A0X8P0Y3_ALCXX|nr:DUF4433 domain-containing protein [Achromobacter xylosoxidans]